VIKKVINLIEALPYIQEFRDDIIVVKFGGSAMEVTAYAEGTLEDVTFMECVGMLPVIVHGGGRAISRGLKKAGITSEFVDGLRVTDKKSIKVVEKVFKTDVNPHIIEMLERMGACAQGVDGETIFRVQKKTRVDESTGKTLDWGFVGEPCEVQVGPLKALLKKRVIPVVTPLGIGPDGKIHNINADTAAASVAKALKARKLVFVSDVPGLLREADNEQSIIATLNAGEVESLIEQGVIGDGMLPKVRSGMEALEAFRHTP